MNPKFRYNKAMKSVFDKRIKSVWLASTSLSHEILRGGINYNAPGLQAFCDYLLKVPHRWSVLLMVFQRDGDRIWTNFEEYRIEEPVLPQHISASLTEKLQAMKSNYNDRHFMNEAWYAVPCLDRDLLEDADLLEEYFKTLGVFDRQGNARGKTFKAA